MPAQPGAPSLADLRSRLPELMLRDERRLRRRLDRVRRLREPAKQQRALDELVGEVQRAEQRLAARRAGVPALTYPAELPITAAREDIVAAIRDHQVVVVAGETGSGKTTQLPKMCLELGLGLRGQVGHTQPRRIAARTVAARIAEELDVELGGPVGYQVRFSERVTERSLVKVMTDGILLAEIQRDPALRSYEAIIIDEAHERSLNIDFLLGYLHQLLPRRPDLKVIITSATIDVERFAAHFADAPIVEVSGRTYPVEVRYRPLDEDDTDPDQVQGICDAVAELTEEGPGDILVFLSGEREIRDTAEAVRAMRLPDTEILPLYARLSAAEQQRVFAPHRGRRVILATNVAETSLTVPGIRYVVDPGTARISRYSNRTKVQRLPIEKVSQASADQRKGRCGRVADGICIRLYAEEDFQARPAYTEPEILRTNLASVILQMAALELGRIDDFGFVDPPDRRSIRDALQLLHELGAVEDSDATAPPRLTPVGRVLARLPVDPRLGRMLVEADRNGCLSEVLVIVAGLAIQDPRERPADQRGTADELHGRFADEQSDFLAFLHLWRYLKEQQRALSSNAFRRRCKAEMLHYLRIREWQDLHSQLRQACKDHAMTLNHSPAADDAVHRSLLAGLLSHIGLRQGDTKEFAGARGARFTIWPGSALARKPPAWVVAAELVETSRLWGRTVARIDPQWAEHLAAHLVQRTYSEPRWSAKRAEVVASERVTLYGVPLVTGRTASYGRIDPAVARALFIRAGLVEGGWRSRHPFLQHNRRLLADLAELEHRTRRRDLVVDGEVLHDFYNARLPADVVSARHFDRWWKAARQDQPDLLTLTREQLLNGVAGDVGRGFPDAWEVDGQRWPLSYRFEPGTPEDGVTVTIPLAALARADQAAFAWQVPGLREELVTALVRGLPKDVRRHLVPIPDTVGAVLADLGAPRGPLHVALAAALHRQAGIDVAPGDFDLDRLPPHLRMTFRIEDRGRVIAQGKDLEQLRGQVIGAIRVAVADASDDLERRGLRSWPGGTLPRTVERLHDGHPVRGYPALVAEGASVGVRVLLTPAEQAGAMWQGTRRLLLLGAPPPLKALDARLGNATKLALTRNPHGSVKALLDDCVSCSVDALVAAAGGPAWDQAGFDRLREQVTAGLDEVLAEVVAAVAAVLGAAREVEGLLAGVRPVAQAAGDDVRRHLGELVHPGFVTATGRDRLGDLDRYVRAMARRLEKAGTDPGRDAAVRARMSVIHDELAAVHARLRPDDPRLQEIRWLVEELYVSEFAQHLGTRGRVSDKRIFRAIAELDLRAGDTATA
jgi:ATP-dependent helicase HrpA